MAASAPVITKKLSSSAITIVGGGATTNQEAYREPESQEDFNSVGAELIYVEINSVFVLKQKQMGFQDGVYLTWKKQ